MQTQADLLGVPVVRSKIHETTALGAAYLAGLGVGFWADQAEIETLWTSDGRFEPAISSNERESRIGRWRQAIDRSRNWAVD